MACVTACPSGVQYDKLIEDTRAQVERNVDAPAARARLPPARVRALPPSRAPARAAPADRAGAAPRPHQAGRAPARAAARAAARHAARALPRRLGAAGAARGCPSASRRAASAAARVALLQGCVQRVFFGHVNEATARVLAAEGFEVHVPRAAALLRRAAAARRRRAGARGLAKATIEALEGYETIVVNSAGCGSAMKDYGHVLRDEPEWADRAERFAAKVRDVTELLAEHEPRAPRGPLPMRLAYHDACHLAHAQGVRSQPRAAAARRSRSSSWWSPPTGRSAAARRASTTCSSPSPRPSSAAARRENLLATGAEAVAAANPGCALQITAHTGRLGTPLPVYHPLELLARSIEAAE